MDELRTNVKPSGWGVRHTVLVLSFLLMFMGQCWRSNLSVAIVAMVQHGKTRILQYFKEIGILPLQTFSMSNSKRYHTGYVESGDLFMIFKIGPRKVERFPRFRFL